MRSFFIRISKTSSRSFWQTFHTKCHAGRLSTHEGRKYIARQAANRFRFFCLVGHQVVSQGGILSTAKRNINMKCYCYCNVCFGGILLEIGFVFFCLLVQNFNNASVGLVRVFVFLQFNLNCIWTLTFLWHAMFVGANFEGLVNVYLY